MLRKLWEKVRRRQLNGWKFRRQHPVGPYIADFACPERGLVVELDGGQHSERVTSDAERTRFIEKSGFEVLRFWNEEVLLELDSVLERIICFLEDPHPLPSGRGINGKSSRDK